MGCILKILVCVVVLLSLSLVGCQRRVFKSVAPVEPNDPKTPDPKPNDPNTPDPGPSGPNDPNNPPGPSSPDPPSLSIDRSHLQDITSSNVANFTLRGSCSGEGRQVVVSVGGVNPSPQPTCSQGSWQVTLDVTSLNKTSGSISITVDHSEANGDPVPQVSASVTNHFVCPANFVGVSSLAGYTTQSFCVAKYEMTVDSGQALSRPLISPLRVNRETALNHCTGMGTQGKYDLMTNDEWQSLARNIELVPSNWSGQAVGSGSLNRGQHVDAGVSAWSYYSASDDDSKGCYRPSQSGDRPEDYCTWDDEKRTHTLSNGEVVWDLAGNLREFVKDSYSLGGQGNSSYMSQVTTTSHPALHSLSGGTTTTARVAKDQFGPDGDYQSFNSDDYGGLGYSVFSTSNSALYITRGGEAATLRTNRDIILAGIFTVYLLYSSSPNAGFRCAYHP